MPDDMRNPERYRRPKARPGLYSWYVLFIMTVIYAVNIIDRQLVSAMAPYIKSDLKISDAELGLLYGTAFALFYGLFGIPLARLADGWSRTRAIAWGLGFWSAFTSACGGAVGFGTLSAARAGVGVGEAVAAPAAISLLSDYFPKSMRATILSIFVVGSYVGLGAAVAISSYIVDHWPDGFGVASWRAAFILMGAFGIFLAILCAFTITEPPREHMDDAAAKPVALVLEEASTMFPPWSARMLYRAGGRSLLTRNLLWLGAIAATALLLIVLTDSMLDPRKNAPIWTIGRAHIGGNIIQWTVMAIAAYATVSWLQSIRLRDAVVTENLLESPVYRYLLIAAGFLGIGTYSTSAFLVLYAHRYLNFSAQDGLTLGSIGMISGAAGILLGGMAGDYLRRFFVAGRLYAIMISYVIFGLASVVQFLTTSPDIFYGAFAVATTFLAVWLGCLKASVQDIALPSTRGIATSLSFLASNLIGLGLGPYWVGFLSDASGSLRVAILSIVVVSLVGGLTALLVASAKIGPAEMRLREREAT